MARCRVDGQADRLEPANELADVFSRRDELRAGDMWEFELSHLQLIARAGFRWRTCRFRHAGGRRAGRWNRRRASYQRGQRGTLIRTFCPRSLVRSGPED